MQFKDGKREIRRHRVESIDGRKNKIVVLMCLTTFPLFSKLGKQVVTVSFYR